LPVAPLRSGTVAAAHAAGTGVYLLSGTGIDNVGISASDQMIADLQTSTSTTTGGILRRCASITLDAFSADATDNIYRNWYISITSGPGVAQSARILHYDGDLKMAIIDCVEHGQSWTGYAQVRNTAMNLLDSARTCTFLRHHTGPESTLSTKAKYQRLPFRLASQRARRSCPRR